MPAPTIASAFMSIQPLEPILVFASSADAENFQNRCRQGRILKSQSGRWVYLPLPVGLLRVRQTRGGDVAFDFDSARHAVLFNMSISELGKIYTSTHAKPDADWTVYLGAPLRQ